MPAKNIQKTYFIFKFMIDKRSVGIIFVPDLLVTCYASYRINRIFLSLSLILLANPFKNTLFQWTLQISIWEF